MRCWLTLKQSHSFLVDLIHGGGAYLLSFSNFSLVNHNAQKTVAG